MSNRRLSPSQTSVDNVFVPPFGICRNEHGIVKNKHFLFTRSEAFLSRFIFTTIWRFFDKYCSVKLRLFYSYRSQCVFCRWNILILNNGKFATSQSQLWPHCRTPAVTSCQALLNCVVFTGQVLSRILPIFIE